MGRKRVFFDDTTGLPIKSSRIHKDIQNAVVVPSSEVSAFQDQENDTTVFVRRKKRKRHPETVKLGNSYYRSSRKMGKSTFFDENGLPLVKPPMVKLPFVDTNIIEILRSSEISEVGKEGNDAAKAVVLGERPALQIKPRKHIFFDLLTGLQIEKSRACINSNDAENVVTESLSESSQIQEDENAVEEVPSTEQSVGDLRCKKKKRRRNRRKIRYCEPFDRLSTIEQLPFEVLEIILSKIPSQDRKNCRLVNKLWYNVLCEQDEFLAPIGLQSDDNENFKIRNTITQLIHLENIGLNHLDLNFKDSNLEFLSENFWKSVGGKIYSLKLENCRLGSSVIETVIKSCTKLQCLKISLQLHENTYDTFCTPESLEKMNIVQEKLKTFELCVASRGNMTPPDSKRVFAALFRTFPNIENYGFDISLAPGLPPFKCSFARVPSNRIEDELQLSFIFSPLLTAVNFDWKRLLRRLSTVKLSSVSLHFSSMKISQMERQVIVDFFASQKALKTVKILPHDSYGNQLRPILLKILDTCSELCELVYCPSRTDDCTRSLTQTDWSNCGSKLWKLEKLSICSFVVDNADASLRSLSSNPNKKSESAIELRDVFGGSSFSSDPDTSDPDEKYESTIELRDMFGRSLCHLIQTFTHLQHLVLVDRVSDWILQTIFQYLTDLKTLDVCLGLNVTEVGIIGHPVGGCKGFQIEESSNGYPINRLKNLERLVLHTCIEWPLKDVIFSAFHFPKLTYFDCFLPHRFWTLSSLGPNIPLLRTAKFSSTIEVANLVDKVLCFCRNANNLETVAIDVPEFEIFPEVTKHIFQACPTLKTIHWNQRTYRYHLNTRKVLLKHPDNLANKHYFFMD